MIKKGLKLYSYRKAAEMVGVSHESIRRYISRMDWELPYEAGSKEYPDRFFLTEEQVKYLKKYRRERKPGRPLLGASVEHSNKKKEEHVTTGRTRTRSQK